jgi:hypothetical protein
MEMKTNTSANAKVQKTEQVVEKKERKPRSAPVAYKMVRDVERLIGEGKGTIQDLVAAGIPERAAKVAVKKLKAEKVIKESFVVVQ